MAENAAVSTTPVAESKRERDEADFSYVGRFDTVVTFIIGNENNGGPKNFLVNKDHAITYSPVFEKAFSSTFEEGLTQTYKIDDVKPQVFHIFVQWLYTQKINVGSLERPHPNLVEELEFFSQSEQVVSFCACFNEALWLLDLWELADRLLMHNLQNMALDQLDKLGTGPRYGRIYPLYGNCETPEAIPMAGKLAVYLVPGIYSKTGDGCLLRRWVVERVFLYCQDHQTLQQVMTIHSMKGRDIQDFLLDVGVLLMEKFGSESRLRGGMQFINEGVKRFHMKPRDIATLA